LKTFTATQLNKSPQEIFAAAKDGTVMIEHSRHPEGFIIMPRDAYTDICEYLKNHESDIAFCVNDFEDLSGVFVSIIGHKARPIETPQAPT